MKKNTTTALIASKVKDIAPELDNVREIHVSNPESPTEAEISLIEGMAAYFLTSEDICDIIKMPRGRWDKHLEFQAAYQRGQGLGRATLRRMQMVTAKTHPIMQIFLGKQYLGQSDDPKAPQGESQLDAYTGFLNKLNIVINVSPTGNATPIVVGAGKGDSEALLETVGTDRTTRTEPRCVVGSDKDASMDFGLGKEQPGKTFHGLVADMVVPGGKGKRQDPSRSRVGEATN